ncbi:MAG: endonuclease/exonuclease/phosphatase family protein [Vampirovibrionales bacterium]|jgi:endonuclease/exonuclease/phosphatase (EEP) superfamily protein YafD|nr:endonuclease/exonuclease/phosphatase family protein [Vampirovibrionales bacterium]
MKTLFIYMQRFVLICGLLLASLPLWDSHVHYGLELAHAFKPFLFIASCLLLVIAVVLLFKAKHKAFFGIFTLLNTTISIALAVQLYADLKPLDLHSPKPSPNATEIKILQHNVYRYADEWTKVLQLLKSTDAQIIALEEVSNDIYNHIRTDAQIAIRFPFKAYRENEELVILSRLPIAETTFHFLGNRGYYAFTLLEAKIQCSSGTFSLIVFHPPHPTSKLNYIEYRQIYQKASDILTAIQDPYIITGDFNSTKFSPQLQAFIRQNKLVNPQVALQQYFGTFPSFMPPYLRIDIDQLLLSKGFQPKSIQALDATESDHVPIQATVLLNPSLNK